MVSANFCRYMRAAVGAIRDIGEDTRAVLMDDLGFSAQDVDRLAASRAVWCGETGVASTHTETSKAAAG